MSNQDDSLDSLLRRSLHEHGEPHMPDNHIAPPERKPTPPDALMSPIRPTVHSQDQSPEPIPPSLPDKPPTGPLTPREQMQRAEEALINLRQKMARIAAEFAQGQLNRAQFDAIYARYSEQRDITERLLARNPDSQAWQSVVQPGHTTFLKQHYEARVLSYAIYDQETGGLITVTGTIHLQGGQVEAVLARLRLIRQLRGDPGPALKKISDGRCVLFMPGEITVAVVIFSLEPSTMQVERVKDIHVDFERANRYTLQNRDYALERMVFPHRALFEENRY